MKLLDLNDDCLHEIFNSKRVSVMDLAMLAQTCTKLREVATDAFERQHKVCDFRKIVVNDYVMADRLLNTFGSSILGIRINFRGFLHAVKVIDSILRNCPELKSLQLISFKIPDCPIAFEKMRQLFGKLTMLHIEDLSIDGSESWHRWHRNDRIDLIVTPNGNVMNLFRDCHSLVDLKINRSVIVERATFQSNFPKLEKLHYSTDYGEIIKDVGNFAFRHPNLETLFLDGAIDDPATIEIISTNCVKLIDLNISFLRYDITRDYLPALRQLRRLPHLKKLGIEFYDQTWVGVLKEFYRSTSLNELTLYSVTDSWDLLPTIAGISTLRTLKLMDSGEMENLHALRNLSQLSELFIEHIDVSKFNFDLVDLIQHLINLKKFKFYVSFYRQRYCISKAIYCQLVNVVKNRPVVENRSLELDCITSDDFVDLLCPNVKIRKF